MQYDLLIFDMDGTILDTLEDLKDSTNAALRSEGLPERSLEEVRRFVGNGIRKLIERAVPADAAPEQVERTFEAFKAYYQEHCADRTRPYDGIPELLERAKAAGCQLAVVSNKADFAVQELCLQYFPGVFDLAVGDRAGIRKKPAPDSVNEVLNRLQIDRSRALYIGDSEVDVETAANAQMESIIVTWGFREASFLQAHGAGVFVNTPGEIAEYLGI